MRRKLFLPIAAALAVAAPAPVGAAAPDADWRCVPVGAGIDGPLPRSRYAGVLNRYTSLHAGEVVGLLHAGPRILLLTTGTAIPRTALRGPGGAGPSGRDFPDRTHRFSMSRGAGTEPGAGPSGALCLADGHRGLLSIERGRAMLAAGASLTLLDPADPGMAAELQAPRDRRLDLSNVAGAAGRLGVHAAVMRERGWAHAVLATRSRDGAIAFLAAPEAALPREQAVMTLRRTAPPPAPRLAAPAPPAERAAVRESRTETRVAEAPVRVASPSRPPAQAATVPAPVPAASSGQRATRTPAAAYAAALHTLAARLGTGVRSVSELTRVHPAVEALGAYRR